MFIKSNKYTLFSIHTLARDIINLRGTVLKGGKVQIIGISSRGYDLKDLDSNEIVKEVSSTWNDLPLFREEKIS